MTLWNRLLWMSDTRSYKNPPPAGECAWKCGKIKNGEMNLQSSGDALFIPCPVRRFSLARLGCGEEGQGLFPVNLHQTL